MFLIAQSMFEPQFVVVAAIAAFLVLLVVDLWSAPACHTQEEAADLSTTANKPSTSRALHNR